MRIDTAYAGLRASAALLTAPLMLLGLGASPAAAASPGPGWTISSMAEPSDFSPARNTVCEAGPGAKETAESPCDHYRLFIENVGAASSAGTITITDTPPSGMHVVQVVGSEDEPGRGSNGLTCAKLPVPQCVYEGSPVPPGGFFTMQVMVAVEPGAERSVENRATVEESGGGVPVSTSAPGSVPNAVNGPSTPFELTSFAFGVDGADGIPNGQAGDHPSSLTVNFGVSSFTHIEPELGNGEKPKYAYSPVENGVKDLAVDLPPGFVGDTQTATQCTSTQLTDSECPPTSKMGFVVFEETGTFKFTGESLVSAVYNMVPEAGYPAEFGFTFVKKGITIYANVAHTARGYVLRAFSPGIVNAELALVSLTFFGDPGEHDGGSPSSGAFFRNPTDCADENVEATVRGTSWGEPANWVSSKTVVYPQVTGCDLLQFHPTIAVRPEVTQTDVPSGYEVDLRVPQSQANYAPVLGTPDLKRAVVALPAGVSVSPSAADGLVGCQESGPSGIDIPSGERLPDEAGEGEEVDVNGLTRLARGHCPAGSQIGTVELETPLLPAHTLTGHVYLAQPKCGGEGQPACTQASATNGELYGIYLEIEGDGVVVKLKGKVEADPSTGQLTTRFEENPQVPFSELRLHLNGGERAPLANPQSCGMFTAATDLEPWSAPQTPDATPSSSFEVGGCAGGAFAPSFSAGTVTAAAGAFSPFTLTFSRHDGEQDLSGLSVRTPAGLQAVLKGVVQCPEPQAQNGECGSQSLIGHAEVAAGAGSQPFWVTGSVYLTGPYRGAPFGLSVVTPAKAGPFNLGNVIVRAAISVDKSTAAVTVTSDPQPQIIDGVPLRIQTVNVTIDRPGFMFNPTNCSQQAIAGTITSAQGASASVSSPFAVTNCAALAFKPSFTASTQANTSKLNGASLDVKISTKAGEANIAKTDVSLPSVLPARLTTLQKACTSSQFAANPAGCPEGSVVGTATAITPVLSSPMSGPAILVSHGGAAFPDLVILLQGEGVTIQLTGNTDIKKGITYSKFDTVPDAPVNSFDLSLPEGPHSILGAFGSLCNPTKTITLSKKITVRRHGRRIKLTKKVSEQVAASLIMPTAITAQNGAAINQNTKITVTGCPKATKATKHSKPKHKKKH